VIDVAIQCVCLVAALTIALEDHLVEHFHIIAHEGCFIQPVEEVSAFEAFCSIFAIFLGTRNTKELLAAFGRIFDGCNGHSLAHKANVVLRYLFVCGDQARIYRKLEVVLLAIRHDFDC
jgi:hypothetical protein